MFWKAAHAPGLGLIASTLAAQRIGPRLMVAREFMFSYPRCLQPVEISLNSSQSASLVERLQVELEISDFVTSL